MFHLPAASDSADIEVPVFRKGDTFIRGPRRVLPGQMGFFMGAVSSHRKQLHTSGAVDPEPREDIRYLQHSRSRKKSVCHESDPPEWAFGSSMSHKWASTITLVQWDSTLCPSGGQTSLND